MSAIVSSGITEPAALMIMIFTALKHYMEKCHLYTVYKHPTIYTLVDFGDKKCPLRWSNVQGNTVQCALRCPLSGENTIQCIKVCPSSRENTVHFPLGCPTC